MCKKSCDWQIDCKAIKVTIPTFGTETVKKIKIPIKTVNTVFASKISGGVKRGNQSNETRVSVAAMAGNFSRTSRKRLNRQGMVYGTRNFRELLLLSSEEISSCSMLDSCQPAGLAEIPLETKHMVSHMQLRLRQHRTMKAAALCGNFVP